MRIVDRKTFLTLPPGTLFAKWHPHVLGELSIKEGTCGEDFVVQTLLGWFEGDESDDDHFGNLLRLDDGGEVAISLDSTGRDGFFDRDQRFAVLDQQDTDRLIERLIDARMAVYGPMAARLMETPDGFQTEIK